MRPRAIVRFERIVLIAYGLGIVSACLEWNEPVRAARSLHPELSRLIGQLVYFGIYALLIWLIARKGSAVARGTFGALVVLAGLVYLATLPAVSDMSFATVLGIAQSLFALASLVPIFGEGTTHWFSGRRPVDPDVFR